MTQEISLSRRYRNSKTIKIALLFSIGWPCFFLVINAVGSSVKQIPIVGNIIGRYELFLWPSELLLMEVFDEPLFSVDRIIVTVISICLNMILWFGMGYAVWNGRHTNKAYYIFPSLYVAVLIYSVVSDLMAY